MVLTHAPELEALFMAEGWGAEQIPVMASDFALAGPTADPAALGKANPPLSITEAFRQIALAKAPFVTRETIPAPTSGNGDLGKKRYHPRGRLVSLLSRSGGKPGCAEVCP